jgi:hypothetical protein
MPIKCLYRIASLGRFDLLKLFIDKFELDYNKLAMECLTCHHSLGIQEISHYNCVNLLLSTGKINARNFIDLNINPRLHRLMSLYINL